MIRVTIDKNHAALLNQFNNHTHKVTVSEGGGITMGLVGGQSAAMGLPLKRQLINLIHDCFRLGFNVISHGWF